MAFRSAIALLFVLTLTALGSRLNTPDNITLVLVQPVLVPFGSVSAGNGSVSDVGSSPGSGANLNFEPVVHTCNKHAALQFLGLHANPAEGSPERIKQIRAMKHMRRVKRVFAQNNVPIVVSNGMLLGWQRSCLATPGDPDSDFIVFGQWIVKAGGLQKLQEAFVKEEPYMSLEINMCNNGPMSAGCELRVTSGDSASYSDIRVLFPPASATYPDRCDNEQCGAKCEKCALSLALWAGDIQDTGKYYACPSRLSSFGFALISFMGETFWAPKNVDEYLVSEYGPSYRKPGEWSVYKPCQANWLNGVDFASKPYLYEPIAGLPDPASILKLQRDAEAQYQPSILESADFEKTLWSNNASNSPWDGPDQQSLFLASQDPRDAERAELRAELRRSEIALAKQHVLAKQLAGE